MPAIRTKHVRVRRTGADETFPTEYAGRVGRVVGRSAEGDLAGVGDTPKDPAYRVQFGPAWGVPAGVDLFWTEELEPVPLTPRERAPRSR